MTYEEIKAGVEEDLYKALDALETNDLITLRQCAARAQSDARELWQKRLQENSDE